ncbi:hypothetical protein PRIPAC_81373 [Pristionchus pacificus]|uniref:Uncharacterized protein n=1 Tax=Pristionchus pacificus TaxID=54126 RepID=A0A2A6BWX4_PRIPA|nr:hypothetical protein PRIPAC_81373 [Pristionchus pacificus]|eukprot:PDM70410.1 hypothetical protein PRIPAC_46656 [Pristionchus pacificus]
MRPTALGGARRVERSSSLLLSSSFSLPMTGGERIKFRLLFLSIKIRARILIDEREFVIFWRRMKRKGGGNRSEGEERERKLEIAPA